MACLGYDAENLSLKLEGPQAGCMWAWNLSGPCYLGHMVRCRLAGVAVGGRIGREILRQRAGLGYDAKDLSHFNSR